VNLRTAAPSVAGCRARSEVCKMVHLHTQSRSGLRSAITATGRVAHPVVPLVRFWSQRRAAVKSRVPKRLRRVRESVGRPSPDADGDQDAAIVPAVAPCAAEVARRSKVPSGVGTGDD
jgi:hypothetical protein